MIRVVDLINKLNGFRYYRVFDYITGENITDYMLSKYEYEVKEIDACHNDIIISAKRVDN